MTIRDLSLPCRRIVIRRERRGEGAPVAGGRPRPALPYRRINNALVADEGPRRFPAAPPDYHPAGARVNNALVADESPRRSPAVPPDCHPAGARVNNALVADEGPRRSPAVPPDCHPARRGDAFARPRWRCIPECIAVQCIAHACQAPPYSPPSIALRTSPHAGGECRRRIRRTSA
jgi:hypothetical protein